MASDARESCRLAAGGSGHECPVRMMAAFSLLFPRLRLTAAWESSFSGVVMRWRRRASRALCGKHLSRVMSAPCGKAFPAFRNGSFHPPERPLSPVPTGRLAWSGRPFGRPARLSCRVGGLCPVPKGSFRPLPCLPFCVARRVVTCRPLTCQTGFPVPFVLKMTKHVQAPARFPPSVSVGSLVPVFHNTITIFALLCVEMKNNL